MSIKFDTSSLRKFRQSARLHVTRELKRQVGVSLRRYVSEHAKDRLSGGDGLRRRTGALARSFKTVVRGESIEALEGVAFSEGVPYAAAHEFGATITPKRGKWLTIPLDHVKTAAGVARYTAREVIANPSIAGMNTVFFHDRLILGSDGSGVTPLFALRKSVKIKAELRFAEDWQRRAPKTRQELRDAIARGLRAARA